MRCIPSPWAKGHTSVEGSPHTDLTRKVQNLPQPLPLVMKRCAEGYNYLLHALSKRCAEGYNYLLHALSWPQPVQAWRTEMHVKTHECICN